METGPDGHHRLPVAALLYAGADERQSYLLTAEVLGADASDERWLTDPARLVGAQKSPCLQ